MTPNLKRIVESTLKSMIMEAPAQETDNSIESSNDVLFTPAEEKFLGKFDAYGSEHLGIIYSISDIGVREFIGRSGKDLNVTPRILMSLLRKKAIRLVPYTGYGKNDDYTIELALSLDDVRGLGAEDKEKIEKGETSGGGAGGSASPMEEPAPGPELAWVVKYGDILKESASIAKQLITEKKTEKKSNKTTDSKVYTAKSRVIKRLPRQYIRQLEQILNAIIKTTKTKFDRERMIADILDNLQVNLQLTPDQIRQSYTYHKMQKRLQKELEEND
jgi:hypothetical protein